MAKLPQDAVGARRWWAMWSLSFICVGPAVVGLLFLVVPGIAFMTTSVSAFSIAIVEDKKPVEAFTASQTLSKGSRWQIAGLLGVAALTIGVILAAAVAAAAFAIGPLGEASADRLWRLVLRPTADFLLRDHNGRIGRHLHGAADAEGRHRRYVQLRPNSAAKRSFAAAKLVLSH